MRRPSSSRQLFADWRRMLEAGDRRSGESPLGTDWIPMPGWYRTTFVKDGPPVPVRVWVERDVDTATGELLNPERILYEIGGERRRKLPEKLVYHAITREAYDAIMADRGRDIRYKATRAAFDLTAVPPRP